MSPARRSFAVYAITRHGLAIADRLMPALPKDADLFVSERFQTSAPPGARTFPLPMGPLLADTFTAYDAHVFLLSIGASVRMVAPLLKNKKVDPAVICVDDAAQFAVCVLSGHVGRGNAFTEKVAAALGATPVVTTASDVIGTLTVDILGRSFGWVLDDMDRNVTRGCAAVVNAERVLFVQETGEPEFWPLDQALPPGVEYVTSLDGVRPEEWEMLLVASDRDVARTHPACFERAVVYRPKSLVVGIGCDRGTPPDLVERGVLSLLERHGLSSKSVRGIATVDLKADEAALLALQDKLGWPLFVYTAAELDAVPGIVTPSDTVKKHVGTRGVAEPAALLAAGAHELVVPKQVYTEPGAGRSMTFAVARAPFASRTAAASRPTVTGGSHP